jgi:hypothetical protein
MTTFNIKINKLNVMPVASEQGLQNVVYSVEYIVHGKDGDHEASVVRTIGLGAPDPADFKALDSLTEQDVIGFVHSSVAPDDIRCAELEVQEAIDKMKSPAPAVVSLQWPLTK